MDYWVQTNEDMNPVLVTGVSDTEMSGIVKLLKALASDGELVEIADSDGNTIYDNYEQWRSVNSSKRTFTKYSQGYVKAGYYEAKAPGYAPNYNGQFFLEPWDLDEYPIRQYDSEAEAHEFADLFYDGRADIVWVDREHLEEYCNGEYDGEICD